jgi:DNA-binding transcriptional regulator YdaS (Cro superfamily)
MEKDHVAALKRAIDSAGSQRKLAERMRAFGRDTASQQLISYWLNNEAFIDAEWWPAIEAATDNLVTRRDLRPDVFTRSHVA